jgi:hypothetical protein
MFYLSIVLLFKISSYHDIAEILVDLALNINQSINQPSRKKPLSTFCSVACIS